MSGDKTSYGNPAGIIERSFDNGKEGVIFVAMNYRLGLFRWLSGSDVTSNAGLLDQRLALEWVKENIHLFGGDPERVTVVGESAGGGSILNHIISYGGTAKAPFQQAVLQSPAFQPTLPSQEKDIFELVLSNASTISNTSVTCVRNLRDLSYETLQELNALIVSNSFYGGFTFGPVVDPPSIPSLPGVSLLNGKFDSSVKVMVGNNSDESLLFTNPLIQTQDQYVAAIKENFPTASQAVITYITETLHPPIFNSTYGYTPQTK